MADLADETRSLSINSEDGDDEEFGFVKRDSAVLAAALTSRKSSSTEAAAAAAAADNNGQSGSGERDEARRTSGTAEGRPTLDNSYPYKADVQHAEPTRGILKAPAVTGKSPFESKKKTSTASSRGADELGELPKAAKKQSTLMKKMSVAKVAATGPVKEDLPQAFQVKYLGQRDARGLWGIKHTRRPVDEMVNAAKSLKVGTVLPLVKLAVTKDGVVIAPIAKTDADERQFYSIDTISYGVQDLVYTRVFSMIIVKDSGRNARDVHPFECHAFVCDSRHSARRLTYSLASAFQEYSRAVNAAGVGGKEKVAQIKKRFAIDLRSPDEIEADLEEETEA